MQLVIEVRKVDGGWLPVLTFIDAAGWPAPTPHFADQPMHKKKAEELLTLRVKMLAARTGADVITRARWESALAAGEYSHPETRRG